MTNDCQKCGEHDLCICPTELTSEDIDKFVAKMMNGDFDLKQRPCFSCNKSHFPSYGSALGECDECYFERWPKEEREAFFRSFFE